MATQSSSTPLATAKAFLAAIKTRNTASMRQMCVPDAPACTIRNGLPILSTIAEVLDRMGSVPADLEMDEISHDEVEHIDGAFATVWTPYKFLENGKVHHTGSNNFCMWTDSERGTWLITSIQDISHLAEGVTAEIAPFVKSPTDY